MTSRRTYLELGRVSNLPTVWTNGITSAVLAGAVLEPLPVMWLIFGFSLFYIAGMYLNDAFDSDFDSQHRPERPIPSGRISRTQVVIIGYSLMGFALAALAVASTLTSRAAEQPSYVWVVCALLLGGFILLYNWRHKQNPWSPLLMGMCRVMVLVTGSFVLVAALPALVIKAALLLLCYLIGLTYIAKQEGLARVDQLWPAALLVLPMIAGIFSLNGQPVGQALIIVLAIVAYTLMILLAIYLVRRGRPPDVPRAVGLLIAGICLLDAMLIAPNASPLWVLLAIGSFFLTLALQRRISGT